jgi:hypothetical protein
MQIKYCINCEEDVILYDGVECHTYIVPVDGWEYDVEFCEGPFASVQPPANFVDDGADGDWDLYLEEPTQSELAKMNLNAEVLYQDFDYEDLKF